MRQEHPLLRLFQKLQQSSVPGRKEGRRKVRDETKKKLDYSINLLQKSEAMALRFDPDLGFCLAFSGGKDSQVLYHVARLAGVKFKAFFSPTSVDPPK